MSGNSSSSSSSSSPSDAAEKSLQFIEHGIRMLSLCYKDNPMVTIDALMLVVEATEKKDGEMDEYRLRLLALKDLVQQWTLCLSSIVGRREKMRKLREELADLEEKDESEVQFFDACESEFIQLIKTPFSRHVVDRKKSESEIWGPGPGFQLQEYRANIQHNSRSIGADSQQNSRNIGDKLLDFLSSFF